MGPDIVLESNSPLPLFKRGKVRDLYDLEDRLLVVSTDRISAFDVVLPDGIPNKGEALNRLSAYNFSNTRDIVANHLLEVVDPRTALVKKATPIKFEFVVRGYLYGSAWENYKKGKPICGLRIRKGLKKAEMLPEPILAPTTKAAIGHDMEIRVEKVKEKIGRDTTAKIEETCLQIYERARKEAEANGIIIADTKMEFGVIDGELILIDELLTPDSSRFWAKEKYAIEKNQLSFDKQYVRDYLLSTNWNKQPPAPKLPESVIRETSKKYVEAFERLTQRKF